ncbi:unnamed protein product [Caretta caretta]
MLPQASPEAVTRTILVLSTGTAILDLIKSSSRQYSVTDSVQHQMFQRKGLRHSNEMCYSVPQANCVV